MRTYQAIRDMYRALRWAFNRLGEMGDEFTIAPDTRHRYEQLAKCPWCDLTQLVGGPYGEVQIKRSCADWQCGGTVHAIQDTV
jgi:hypothetical protein